MSSDDSRPAPRRWQAGVPVVVLDPVGVWWGIRSSADGTGEAKQ